MKTPTTTRDTVRECGRHGDYLDVNGSEHVFNPTGCPDCGRAGELVGFVCTCADVNLDGTERVPWTCDRCFGTVVRPLRTAN